MMNVDPCRQDENTRGRSPDRRSSSLPPETPFGVWTLRWAGSISNGTLVPCHARRMSVRTHLQRGYVPCRRGDGQPPRPRRRSPGASGDRVARSDAPQVRPHDDARTRATSVPWQLHATANRAGAVSRGGAPRQPRRVSPTHTVTSSCAEAQRLHPINGIRTRVYAPPRAFLAVSGSYALLTQHRAPGDSNSEAV